MTNTAPMGPSRVQTAALRAMRALTHRVDRTRESQPYFWLNLTADPPRLEHQSWDYCDMSGRWVDGLLLGRLMTGVQECVATEEALRAFLLGRANPRDGLFYNADAPEYGSRYGADIFCQSRVLIGLLSWWMETGDGTIEASLDRLVRGLHAAAAWDGDVACYPATLRGEGRWLNLPTKTAELDPKVAPALGAPGYRTTMIGPLVVYHELSGSATALDLASALARYYVGRSGAVNADGSYIGHTHSGGVLPTTTGVLRYGLATANEELIRWGQRVYEYTAGHASSFGWLPDGIGFPADYMWGQVCETCALADYLELGILLSEAGVGDYWDQVERCASNQLLANQFRAVGDFLPPETEPAVRDAVLGSFACSARPNCLLGWNEGLEGCCVGSGLHALYLVWRHGLTEQGTTVTVNLPVSPATETLDIINDEPAAGRVRMHIKRPCSVSLRIPEHARQSAVDVQVNGEPYPEAVSGGWCRLASVAPGTEIVVSYPLAERQERVTVAGCEYTVRWRGGTVIGIEPAGHRAPAYGHACVQTDDELARALHFTPATRLIPW